MPLTVWHRHTAVLWLLLALVSLVCQTPYQSQCVRVFFQCKLLISMINTSESDPPSFRVENANYTLMRLKALSITGQDESIACFLLRLSQWSFYLQLHSYLPCCNIQLLSLSCTDIQGQSCFQMGTNAPLKKNKKKKEKYCIESALKQNAGMHRIQSESIILNTHLMQVKSLSQNTKKARF